jgi:signal peptidase II
MTRYLLLAVGALTVIALDQITKVQAAAALVLPDGRLPEDAHQIRTAVYPVFDSWFNLRIAGNKGAAWGIFRDLPEEWRVTFFAVIGVFAIAAIILFYRSARGQKLLSVALTLILGGAIGNLIDRVRLGYVVDFIDWYYQDFHWPTFNIADVGITVGVSLLLIDMIIHRGDPKRKTEPAPAN